MPVEQVQRINLDLIYPPFLEVFLNVLAQCKSGGASYVATLGFRTRAEQDALYSQGRSKPGPRVTNARGGYSLHNFGLAVDVVRDSSPSSGLQPDWALSAYSKLAECGHASGLQVGVPGLADPGHIQTPARGWFGVSEGDLLATLRKARDLKACWTLLDSLRVNGVGQ